MVRALPLTQVKPGMVLAEDVFNQNRQVLVREGVVLTDKIIKMLLNNHSISNVVVQHVERQPSSNSLKFETGLSLHQTLLEKIRNEVKNVGKSLIDTNFVQHPKRVELIFLQAIEQVEILELLLKMRVSTNGRDQFNRYIKTSILATATGIQLNLRNEELVLLARAGLVYDIGNCIVDQKLLYTNEALSTSEKMKLDEHVNIGFQILQENFPEEISLPAYQHHERFDGSGYPNQLNNKQLHPFSRIISIVDVYTALSSVRPYRPAHPTSEVIEFLLGSGNILFDYKIISEFLKIVKIYVVGSLVLLNNGDIGIVTEIENRPIGKPVVKLLYDKEWRSLHGKEVDLGRNHLYYISKVID